MARRPDGEELLDALLTALLALPPDELSWLVYYRLPGALGETTLLDVLWHLVPKPLGASNVTAASIFRTIEAARPTSLRRGGGSPLRWLRGEVYGRRRAHLFRD